MKDLGINEAEERTYRWLLRHGPARVSEVSEALTFTSSKVQRLLDSIEGKGLVTCSPEHPRRYIPASPDIALGGLLLQRQQDLQKLELTIRELQKKATSKRGNGQKELVELITSREAKRQVYQQIPLMATDEVVALVRAPMMISQLDADPEEDNRAQRESINRGVRYRSIVDKDFLELPGAMNATNADIKAGEQVRIVSRLPLKMVIADKRIALIPLDLEQSDSPALLVRSPALLYALYGFFQMIWERAVPIPYAGVFQPDGFASLSERTQNLISLMAIGSNDKSIAAHMGVSLRTLQRYVADLMRLTQTRTRFQLGWFAALRYPALGSAANENQGLAPTDKRTDRDSV